MAWFNKKIWIISDTVNDTELNRIEENIEVAFNGGFIRNLTSNATLDTVGFARTTSTSYVRLSNNYFYNFLNLSFLFLIMDLTAATAAGYVRFVMSGGTSGAISIPIGTIYSYVVRFNLVNCSDITNYLLGIEGQAGASGSVGYRIRGVIRTNNSNLFMPNTSITYVP